MNSRAVETDKAVREGDLRDVLTFYLMRHSALLTAEKGSDQEAVYKLARDSAEREILWRFSEQAAALEDARNRRNEAQAQVGAVVAALLANGYRFPVTPNSPSLQGS